MTAHSPRILPAASPLNDRSLLTLSIACGLTDERLARANRPARRTAAAASSPRPVRVIRLAARRRLEKILAAR